MIDDDQKTEETKRWLEKQSSDGNVLAAAFDSILIGAHPEVRKKYQVSLYDLMKVGENIAKVVGDHNDKNS